MYIAICDDNPADSASIANIISDFSASHGLNMRVCCFSDAEDMLAASHSTHFTHYFLDIIMPGMDGITAAREIRKIHESACLVFLSASNEYAHQSYRVEAFDYLLKPVNPEHVHDLLIRWHKQNVPQQNCLCIQKGRGFIRLPVKELTYLEINQKQLYFHLSDGNIWQVPGTLAEYEKELLSTADFVKIHRSYLVNLQHVHQLLPEGCIMFSGKNLPISRLLYNNVRKRYLEYLFGSKEV